MYTGRQAAVYQKRRHEVWGDPEADIATCDGQSRFGKDALDPSALLLLWSII